MDKDKLNRRLHEALGHCYHEWDRITVDCETLYQCRKCRTEAGAPCNVDYIADPRLVLREMREREDYPLFGLYVSRTMDDCFAAGRNYIYWSTGIVLDETGRLAKLALDWLERGE